MDREGQLLARRNSCLKPGEIKGLGAVQMKCLGVRAILELTRQHPHPDQVAAMYSLEALGDHSADAEQSSPLRSPIARAACAVLLTREHHQRNAFELILH